MIVKALKITEISLTNIDAKNSQVDVHINFSNDSPLAMRAHFDSDYELFINKLIKTIKANKYVDNDYDNDDSVLRGVSIITVINEEEVKEVAPKRFMMLNNRIDSLRTSRSASEYMKLYSQMSTLREVIYQSN